MVGKISVLLNSAANNESYMLSRVRGIANIFKTELFTLYHGDKTGLFRSENITVVYKVTLYENSIIKTALYASHYMSVKSQTLLFHLTIATNSTVCITSSVCYVSKQYCIILQKQLNSLIFIKE